MIVAWHVDRITRSVINLEQLIGLCEEHQVVVATATGDLDLTFDTGRMLSRILAAVARGEVERKAARQRLANSTRASEGRPPTGPRAFGYVAGGLQVVDTEATLIREGCGGCARREPAAYSRPRVDRCRLDDDPGWPVESHGDAVAADVTPLRRVAQLPGCCRRYRRLAADHHRRGA